MSSSPTFPICGEAGEAPTFCAPGERFAMDTVKRQSSVLENTPLGDVLLNGGSQCYFILNSLRQIVAASRNLIDLTEIKDLDGLLGKRPGEALACVNSMRCESGCGTSEFCRECGALKAILLALSGLRCSEECRMTRTRDGVEESLELQVLATPLEYLDEKYALIAIHDISHEKRRQALERIFFHDVINLAGGMEGILYSLRENVPDDLKGEVELSYSALRELIDEIVYQRDLAAAERNELPVVAVKANSLALLRQVASLYRNHPATGNRSVEITPDSEAVDFVTDVNLLRRVLGNLVKNAAEASVRGELITLSCFRAKDSDRLLLKVHNARPMAPEIQRQVFQRSFSTKGHGRGLGTYSVKLIGEKYLKGEVTFESDPSSGTVFCISLPLSL